MIGDMEMSQEASRPVFIGNLMLLKEVPGGALGGGVLGGGARPPRPDAQGGNTSYPEISLAAWA